MGGGDCDVVRVDGDVDVFVLGCRYVCHVYVEECGG